MEKQTHCPSMPVGDGSPVSPSLSAGTGRDGLDPVWKSSSSRPDELAYEFPLSVLGQLFSFIGH